MRKFLFCLAGASALCGAAWAGAMVNVSQKGLAFSTAQLTVNKGDIVNFSNDDTTSHNILIVGGSLKLNSGLQAPGVSFKAPMMTPGTYQAICGIHPKMKMTIVVK